MSSPSSRLIDACKAVTMSSEGVGKRNSYRVGAILFEKNRILEARTNSRKTHPALAKFTKWPYLHAETSCLISHGLGNCTGTSLLVLRMHRDNTTLSCAKPCPVCEGLLELSGVKRVYYSDWNGDIKCL